MTAHELARLLLDSRDMNTATAAKVRNHGDAVAFFAARRADLLRVAQENVDERTVPVFRWACPCGRFIPEGSIETTDRRDDSTYYGISTETRYACSRCGVVYGEPWLTQIGTTVVERGEVP